LREQDQDKKVIGIHLDVGGQVHLLEGVQGFFKECVLELQAGHSP